MLPSPLATLPQSTFQETEADSSVATRPISQWSRRVQAALGITELVNQQSNRFDIMDVFSKEALTWAGMDQALVVETRGGNLRLVHVVGIARSIIGQP